MATFTFENLHFADHISALKIQYTFEWRTLTCNGELYKQMSSMPGALEHSS